MGMMHLDDIPPSSKLLSGHPVIISQPVAWGELDMHGHVNNVWILRYVENARIAYYEAIDKFSYEQKTGAGFVLAETSCRFKRPLTHPDTVLIGTRVTSVLADRMIMAYRLVSQTRKHIAAEASATLVSYSFRKNLKIPFPQEIRERIHRLEKIDRIRANRSKKEHIKPN